MFEHARLGNHPSFRERGQSSTPAGYDVIVEHLNAGFGRLFESVPRSKEPVIPGETVKGQLIVWRVLGFVGKPNPSPSRAASFAARTAQALLRTSSTAAAGALECAPGLLQLYVDDPVLSLAGSPASAAASADLVLLWWLGYHWSTWYRRACRRSA